MSNEALKAIDNHHRAMAELAQEARKAGIPYPTGSDYTEEELAEIICPCGLEFATKKYASAIDHENDEVIETDEVYYCKNEDLWYDFDEQGTLVDIENEKE